MGNDQSNAAQQAETQNVNLSNQLYGIAAPALSSSMSYLTQAYGQGQMLGTNQKYQAETTNFLDQSAGQNGSFLDPKAMGNALSGRAAGLSGIGTEQIGGAVDEMNKIRSLLGGQGMNTTNEAGAAGGLETSALKYMNQGNQIGSTVKGIAGGGSALYGAGQKAGWWGQATTTNNTGTGTGTGGDTGGLGGGQGAWGGGGF